MKAWSYPMLRMRDKVSCRGIIKDRRKGGSESEGENEVKSVVEVYCSYYIVRSVESSGWLV